MVWTDHLLVLEFFGSQQLFVLSLLLVKHFLHDYSASRLPNTQLCFKVAHRDARSRYQQKDGSRCPHAQPELSASIILANLARNATHGFWRRQALPHSHLRRYSLLCDGGGWLDYFSDERDSRLPAPWTARAILALHFDLTADHLYARFQCTDLASGKLSKLHDRNLTEKTCLNSSHHSAHPAWLSATQESIWRRFKGH